MLKVCIYSKPSHIYIGRGYHSIATHTASRYITHFAWLYILSSNSSFNVVAQAPTSLFSHIVDMLSSRMMRSHLDEQLPTTGGSSGSTGSNLDSGGIVINPAILRDNATSVGGAELGSTSVGAAGLLLVSSPISLSPPAAHMHVQQQHQLNEQRQREREPEHAGDGSAPLFVASSPFSASVLVNAATASTGRAATTTRAVAVSTAGTEASAKEVSKAGLGFILPSKPSVTDQASASENFAPYPIIASGHASTPPPPSPIIDSREHTAHILEQKLPPAQAPNNPFALSTPASVEPPSKPSLPHSQPISDLPTQPLRSTQTDSAIKVSTWPFPFGNSSGNKWLTSINKNRQ